jgi:hypothetical protein
VLLLTQYRLDAAEGDHAIKLSHSGLLRGTGRGRLQVIIHHDVVFSLAPVRHHR